MTARSFVSLGALIAAAGILFSQTPAAEGRKIVETRCSVCHGADGDGGEMGPAIVRRLPGLPDAQLKTTIHEGLP